MKCDFCEKDSVGYVFMQAAFYCEAHRVDAEKIEEAIIDQHEKVINRYQEAPRAKLASLKKESGDE